METLQTQRPNSHSARDRAGDIALYLHIPFCQTKCPYCDFNTYAGIRHLLPSYLEALETEVGLWAETLRRPAVTSVFLGGGTPSLLEPGQMHGLLEAVGRAFPVGADAEVTAEVNPDDVTLERLRGFRAAGVNRISMGVQSLEPELLTLLGRRHSAADARRAYGEVRRAGFSNVSMDLMYGLPTQILAQWQSTLAAILELAPEHLSAYCLTLEPETPMARQTNAGTLPEPDPDLAATMYEWAAEELASHGYQGYEISNWAQPGSESRHNLTYWQNLPYLGVGPGAHSSLGGARFSLLLSPARYIHAVGRWAAAGAEHAPVLSSTVLRRLPTVSSAEAIPQPLEMAETLMLGLRLHVGVGLEEFQERFGMSMLKSHGEFIQQVTALGLAELTGRGREGRLRLTPRGRLLGNQVFSRLFEAPAQSRART